MHHSVCASGTIDLDLRQLALEELLEHSHGVIIEIPRRTMIRVELELIRIAKEGGTSDFLEGALSTIRWLSNGGPSPYEAIMGLLS